MNICINMDVNIKSFSKLKKKKRVFFGHWAALQGLFDNKQFVGLDTGYVWGGALTVIRLEDLAIFSYNKET